MCRYTNNLEVVKTLMMAPSGGLEEERLLDLLHYIISIIYFAPEDFPTCNNSIYCTNFQFHFFS